MMDVCAICGFSYKKKKKTTPGFYHVGLKNPSSQFFVWPLGMSIALHFANWKMAQTYFVDLPFLNVVMFQFAKSNNLPEGISMYIPLCSSSKPVLFGVRWLFFLPDLSWFFRPVGPLDFPLHLLMIRWQSSLFEESASSWRSNGMANPNKATLIKPMA
jgi:hypothetical protein